MGHSDHDVKSVSQQVDGILNQFFVSF